MIELLHSAEIRKICEAFRVKRLHAFGSAVVGEEGDPSDIDLLVEFDRQGYEGAFEQLMGLKEALESVLERPVDLMVDKPFRNHYFQQEVDRTKQLIYAA